MLLHIGAHKTGTTAVQSMLLMESRRLRRYGFYYERAFYRLGKALARGSPLAHDQRDSLHAEFQAQLRARPEPYIIGSAEGLFGDLFRSYANIRAVAEDLRQILEGHDVHIVACIRRQDDFLQSVHQQYVKSGGTQRFEQFIQTHDIHAYRWNELLGHYAAVFGRSAVSVRCYEDLFQEPDAVLAGLFEPLAAAGFRSAARPPRRNPSLSAKGIEIAIRCNDALEASERRTLRRFLQNAFSQQPGETASGFTDEQRDDLLRFYADSNRQCIAEFLPAPPQHKRYVPIGVPAGHTPPVA